ncbi:hypothetical protein [Kocuria sp. LHG3120]|uniref:hypothetical protein n=1 Tax=Kocuria sp. LHG3120 TaxID=2804590 RepID=UPI003CF53AE1
MVVATGAYGNIGDAVIRRRVISWARGLGQMHVYVGNGDQEWLQQLNVESSATLYSAKYKFRWLLLPLKKKKVRALVFDPGAIPLDRSALPAEFVYLILTLLVRIRGGVVIRPPRGVKQGYWLTVLFHRLGARASNITLWRTRRSFDLIRVGEICPDTAFQEPKHWRGIDDSDRRYLGISLRGKNALPSEAWFSLIQQIVGEHKLTPVVFAQVREDEERAAEIAKLLGSEHFVWGECTELDHEARLQGLYKRSSLIVSDRLHVLILGALTGAIPLEIVDVPSGKVREHFGQIEVHDISFSVEEAVAIGANAIIDNALGSRDLIRRRIDRASIDLDNVVKRVRSTIG